MQNIAIYYRVSTDKQDLISQRDAVESWLNAIPKDKRPTSVRVFQDEGRSGKDDGRPGFQTMLTEAKSGAFDTIIVYKLDRLSRSANTAIRTILDLDSQGVAFVSTSQPILNLGHENPFRRTMLSAFAEIAEIERETTVARVKAGLDAARRRGVKLGRPAVSRQKKARIRELLDAGFDQATISRQLRLSRTTVWKVLKEA